MFFQGLGKEILRICLLFGVTHSVGSVNAAYPVSCLDANGIN